MDMQDDFEVHDPTIEEIIDNLDDEQAEAAAEAMSGDRNWITYEKAERVLKGDTARSARELVNRKLEETVGFRALPEPDADPREYERDVGQSAVITAQYETTGAPEEGWAEQVLKRTFPGFRDDFVKMSDNSQYKSVYVEQGNHDQNHIAYVPSHGDDFRDRMERVLTWKRNADKLQENGINTAADSYDVVVTTVGGEACPVLVGEYNGDMKLLKDMDQEECEAIQQDTEYVREKIKNMEQEGDFLAAEKNDYTIGDENLAYEEGKGVVAVDLGELTPWYFSDTGEIQGPYDSRDEYLEETGLKDTVDKFDQQVGNESTDTYGTYQS